jgi:hypothetical protein
LTLAQYQYQAKPTSTFLVNNSQSTIRSDDSHEDLAQSV